MLNIRTATSRKYISRHDDAIDWKKIGKSKLWARFVDGDLDLDKVPIRPGCKPAIFSLRRLSRAQWRHVISVASPFEQFHEAVAYGLAGWEGFGGAVRETEDSDNGPRLTEKCLDEIFVPELIREFGPIVLGMSMLGPTSGQG